MTKPDTASPCIGICRYDKSRVCIGCFRTRDEVKTWKSLPKGERVAINRRVLPQMAAAGHGPYAKKLAKLDRKIVKLTVKLARLRTERDGLLPPSG